MREKILIVADDIDMRRLLTRVVSGAGIYTVLTAQSSEDAVEKTKNEDIDLILADIDIKMQKMDGVGIIDRIREIDDRIQVILLTAVDNVEAAKIAVDRGVASYITKPFSNDELVLQVNRVLERQRVLKGSQYSQSESRYGNIIGSSREMKSVYNLINKVSKSEATVLVTGESGTGKELVARAIHYESDRRNKAFQVIDCTAFPEAILESELFGHIRGAFTGAIRDKRGLLEEADGGTVFFDEIGDLSLGMQMKLLRVLQEGEFKPVGGLKTKNVDLRVVAATNRNLEDMVAQKYFREDLYYRLNVVSIKLPPLRAKSDDIYLLAYYFLERFGQAKGHKVTKIDPDAMALLTRYGWPGNVRELENVIERAVILSKGDTILDEDLAPSIKISAKQEEEEDKDIYLLPYKVARRKVIESFTYEYLRNRLERNKGNVTKAAQESGLLREAFHQIMKRYNIKSSEFKDD